MIGVLCVVLLAGVLWGAISVAGHAVRNRSLVVLLMGGYFLRIGLALVIRDIPFFSHGAGGDCIAYELYARAIARIWNQDGISYITGSLLGTLGATSLPPNLFAVVGYFDDGAITMRLGCTAIVALAVGLTALNLYALALEFGAESKSAFLFTAVIYLQPSVLFYTCDTYKDGLVLCFTFGALGSALRLAHRLSLLHLVIGLTCLWALFYVRFYLIFVTVAPFVVGVVGMNAKSMARSVLVALSLVAVGIALAGYTDILQIASERASETLDTATSAAVLGSNSQGGSGVEFDDGGNPLNALPAKFAYTLLSPFLWSGGSLGFQIGKLDVLIWYFVIYRAVRAAFQVKSRLVVMLATFVVPCATMYAMSMSNVGLIVRQRLVIVVATTLLAALYRPKKKSIQKARPRNQIGALPRRLRTAA